MIPVDAYGHLDIVDANHAYSRPDRLETMDAAELDRHLSINVRGSPMLAKVFAAQHDGRPGGRVVLMTLGQHLGFYDPDMVSYMVSKGAVHQATRLLSASLAGKGITVNTVNPGPTDTGWASEAQRERVLVRMAMGRWGEPDDVARLIAWLCTDDARWITGQVLDSEGGFRQVPAEV
jgi:3-oxoacyl-[acyl-carrier protein] reductase